MQGYLDGIICIELCFEVYHVYVAQCDWVNGWIRYQQKLLEILIYM